jgi:SnoaL-like domain
VWTADAVWRVRDDLAFVGLDEISGGIERQWEVTLRAFHWTSNPSISIDKDGLSARAHFDVHTETQLADESWVWRGCSSRDTYVRSEVGWRLSSRTAEILAPRVGSGR